ncbi:MAG: hypothetical protein WCJ09_23615 [Planctomycetota bacterium]
MRLRMHLARKVIETWRTSDFSSSTTVNRYVLLILAIMCNIVAIALQADRSVETVLNLLGFGLFLFGLVAALFALASVRKCGYRKILIPALFGLTLNSAIIAVLANAILLSARRTNS